jgi:DNA-binding MarR family transcriptional regulator
MEILNNGSIPSGRTETVEEQVKLVVHGFVQIWNKFEDTIASEMAAHAEFNKSAQESRFGANNDILFRVGTVLDSLPGPTMGELGSALSVPLSTATRIVDSLVGRGYLERFPDSADRRIVRVRLTHKGNEVFQFIDSRIAEHVKELASSLSSDEMATLMKLLGKVAFAANKLNIGGGR